MTKTYAYHKPSSEGLESITELRESFRDLHELIESLAPECRERSIALTNLEQSAMWAIKAVVFNDKRSEVDI